MSLDPPSPDQIEAWIAGRLPAEEAAQIEAYFEQYPEKLANPTLEKGILKEAAQTVVEDPELVSFIDSLRLRPFEIAAEDQWMDLLEATDQTGLLGTLDSYEVHEVIATTGMTTILKAHDPNLDRSVAIKILSPLFATQATARERFLREARAMATLEHENILPIYGVYPDTIPRFAMRYIEGGSLQDALDVNAPQLREPAFLESLARQMASALSKAHADGIIHRDLKPANILLDPDGNHLWLADFGIARAIDDPNLTMEKTVAGTPRYMSPEQAQGHELDHRTDLFSLGSVLYHCATGNPPFEGKDSTVIISRVAQGNTTSCGKLSPALPNWLTGIIDQLLEKSPDNRPENADVLLSQIETHTYRRARPLKLLAAIAAIFLISFLTLHFWPDHPTSPASQSENSIRNLATGEVYSDLRTAVTEAETGSTLALNGWFLLDKSLATRTNFDLHLTAAGKATPTIEFRHRDPYGILVEGNTSARGITFLCTERIDEGFDFIVSRGADEVAVSNCIFDDRIPKGISWAVRGEAAHQISIQSSKFYGKELCACLLIDSEESTTARDSRLLVEDCILEARAIGLSRANFPGSEFDIILKSNKLNGDTVFGFSKYRPIRPIRFTALDNEFIVSNRHLHVALGPIPDSFEWHGERNTYTEGTPFVRISRPKTRFIKTLADFLNEIPRSKDSGAKFFQPSKSKEE